MTLTPENAVNKVVCHHCGRDISDKPKDTWWSRGGEHWCGFGCFDQDYHLIEGMKETRKGIKRRRRKKG